MCQQDGTAFWACLPCKQCSQTKLARFGVGISLYFKFIKWLVVVYGIMGILLLPALWFNVNFGSEVNQYSGGVGSIAVTTVGNLGQGAKICGTAFENEVLQMKCPNNGIIGAIETVEYGELLSGGTCGCPPRQQPDPNTLACPSKPRSAERGPSTCVSGEFCVYGTEPTMLTDCCAPGYDTEGRLDWSAIVPTTNSSCSSSSAVDIISAMCLGRGECEVELINDKHVTWEASQARGSRCLRPEGIGTDGPCNATLGDDGAFEACASRTSPLQIVVQATCFSETVIFDSIFGVQFDEPIVQEKANVKLAMTVLDFLATGIFIFSVVVLVKGEQRDVDAVDGEATTLADYSIFLESLPEHQNADLPRLDVALRKHFEAVIPGSKVALLEFALTNASSIALMRKRGSLIHSLERTSNRRRSRMTMGKRKQSIKLGQQEKKLLDNLSQIDDKLDVVEAKPRAVRAFITFEDEESMIKAIDSIQTTPSLDAASQQRRSLCGTTRPTL